MTASSRPGNILHHPAAKQVGQHDAGGDARRVEPHRRGALPGRIEVGDHRMRGRTAAGLTDADADAREGELHEVGHQPRERCHAAPERHRKSDQVAAIVPVGVARDRDAEDDVEHGEGRSRQEPEPGVTDLEFLANRRQQDRQYLAIDEVEHVDDGENHQRVPARAGGNHARRGHRGSGTGPGARLAALGRRGSDAPRYTPSR